MILSDIDLGGRPPHPVSHGGQVTTADQVPGTRAVPYSQGGDLNKLDIDFWIEAWLALGGSPAGSLAALRLLLGQLEELRQNPDLQPIYLQLAQTAQPSPVYPTRSDPHDGWYLIDALEADPETYNQKGAVQAKTTLTRIVPATPSSLATRFGGAAFSSSYSAAPVPMVGFPIGSTQQAPNALSRTGGEGVIPLSVASALKVVPSVRPGTVAALFTGGVRVYDTINTGSNPVPGGGTFVNANWVQVYGTQHDFVGDCVVTNGLLLLLFQVGQVGVPTVYVWNTSLSPAAWQNRGWIQYNDNSSNVGTLREINLERVGLEEARLRITASTSAGNWAKLVWRLQRGHYDAPVEFWPQTQTMAQSGLLHISANVLKINYTEGAVQDAAISPNTSVGTSSVLGFGAAFGQTANDPLIGWLFQNAPSFSQSIAQSTTVLPTGDTTGPAQGLFSLYSFFAAPFGNNGASVEKLQAEGESGTLGTGWSSVADGIASNGNTAKVASGTLANNADTFGTSWLPPAGQYDVWFRIRVTSNSGSALEMKLGLWDATSAAFVANGSTTLEAVQLSSMNYIWIKVNSTSPLSLPAGHNMQFRAVTALTLGTDWFIDEAVLVPVRSATLGVGNFPGDIWAQFGFPLTARCVRG